VDACAFWRQRGWELDSSWRLLLWRISKAWILVGISPEPFDRTMICRARVTLSAQALMPMGFQIAV